MITSRHLTARSAPAAATCASRRAPRRTPLPGSATSRSGRVTRRDQRGVALAISLVLLVAMTVVGIATLAGTRLNEKVTSNAQQKSVAFEVAESSIDTVWDPAVLMGSVASIPEAEFDEPKAVAPSGVAKALSNGFDQKSASGERSTVDIEGEVTIRYCGEGAPAGSSMSADESEVQMAGVLFDVNGVAEIHGSATRSDHVQRGSLVRPRTGRKGGCTVPGL